MNQGTAVLEAVPPSLSPFKPPVAFHPLLVFGRPPGLTLSPAHQALLVSLQSGSAHITPARCDVCSLKALRHWLLGSQPRLAEELLAHLLLDFHLGLQFHVAESQ